MCPRKRGNSIRSTRLPLVKARHQLYVSAISFDARGVFSDVLKTGIMIFKKPFGLITNDPMQKVQCFLREFYA